MSLFSPYPFVSFAFRATLLKVLLACWSDSNKNAHFKTFGNSFLLFFFFFVFLWTHFFTFQYVEKIYFALVETGLFSCQSLNSELFFIDLQICMKLLLFSVHFWVHLSPGFMVKVKKVMRVSIDYKCFKNRFLMCVLDMVLWHFSDDERQIRRKLSLKMLFW